VRKTLAICVFGLLLTRSVIGDDQKAVSSSVKPELLGSWECVLDPAFPESIHHIKLVTPTHYTWVTYDAEKNAVLATSGGTCSMKGDLYEEAAAFASDSHQHLRGKTYGYSVTLRGDKWGLHGILDGGFIIDEVWTRTRLAEAQKTNTERPGKDLLGAWTLVISPESPRAVRTVKVVTPTHWTWVSHDRENKMVLPAAGGTWYIKDGKYQETCDFSTDNMAGARGRSFTYPLKVNRDHWTLRGKAESGEERDEIWMRVK
jgi:hypothetical protein